MKVKVQNQNLTKYVIVIQTRKMKFCLKNLIAMKLINIAINIVYFYFSLI